MASGDFPPKHAGIIETNNSLDTRILTLPEQTMTDVCDTTDARFSGEVSKRFLSHQQTQGDNTYRNQSNDVVNLTSSPTTDNDISLLESSRKKNLL